MATDSLLSRGAAPLYVSKAPVSALLRTLLVMCMVGLCTFVQSASAQSSAACSIRGYGANSFTLAPYGVTATATNTDAPSEAGSFTTLRFTDNQGIVHPAVATTSEWISSGTTTASLTITFSQAIPANWISFHIFDFGNGGTAAYNPAFTFSVSGGTATRADFARANISPATSATYNATTGAIRKSIATQARESLVLVGTTADTVRTITISGSGIAANDNIGYMVTSLPSCIRVQKVSRPSVGSFSFSNGGANLVTGTNVAVANTTLTTTAANTAVTSPLYFARTRGVGLTITEAVPANWTLASAVCTDQNASRTGNPASFGTLSGTTLTIPATHVRGESDIRCLFTDDGAQADLAITKDDGSATYTPGTNVTYTIVVRNNGPDGVTGARVTDALPTGISSASWTCGSATGGGVCGAASGTGAINTTANLPNGATITYSMTLTVPPTFTGNLVNTARVAVPAVAVDTNLNNNAATDTDTQFPPPPANTANLSCTADPNLFSTAYNGAGGRMASGADSYWQVAATEPNQTGIPAGLSYATAQVINPLAAHFSPSPYATANWISSSSTGFQGPTTQRNDYFFRYQFNLGPSMDPAAFQLAMNFMADNAVENVYVNGMPSNVRSNYGADAYAYDGFTTANAGSGVLAGPWQSGLNEIVVHVKSQGDYVGFVAQNTPQPLCAPATVTLNKITQRIIGGPFGFDLANTVQATGNVSTTAIDTPTQADGDTNTAGIQPFTVASFGTDVMITENALPTDWLLSDVVCTAEGTPIGSRLDNAYTIPGSMIDVSGESFVCTFTNTPTTNLSIDKIANPTTRRTGEAVTYTITADNAGPGPGDGAVISDPPVVGVDCDAATLSCNANGGAVCPALLDVATFQDTGLTIPAFPAGGSLQFGMACTVTATGQ